MEGAFQNILTEIYHIVNQNQRPAAANNGSQPEAPTIQVCCNYCPTTLTILVSYRLEQLLIRNKKRNLYVEHVDSSNSDGGHFKLLSDVPQKFYHHLTLVKIILSTIVFLLIM